MMNKRVFAVAWWLLVCTMMMAQTKKSFSLDDLMWGGSNYWNIQPKNLSAVFWGEKLVEQDVEEVRLLTDEKGKRAESRVLFTLDEVNAALDTATLGKVRTLQYVSFPFADETEALIEIPAARLLYDWEAGRVTWTQSRVVGAVGEDFCKESRALAYVKDWNLYVRTAEDEEIQVSEDGTREVQYGLSVHREEFGIYKGTFWSPCGNLLAFYRMDQRMVTDFPLVDIDHPVAQLAPEKYPMAGQTSHLVTVGVFNPATKETVYLQAGDPTDRYFTNVAWSPDERTVYLIELPRSQDKAELVAYDAATGARKGVLYTETNEKYVEPMHPIAFLPWDEEKFVYQSRKDGFNHLYLFDITGKELKQLTKGEFEVTSVLGFNEKTKSIVYSSNEASPIRYNHYRVVVPSGKCTRLDNGLGKHAGVLSQSGEFVLDRWSSPEVFRQVDLLATASAKVETLQVDGSPWTEYEVPQIKSGTIKAADGETDLFYRMVLPVGFDPEQKYPTVVYVYGGPHLHNVDEGWNYASRPWEIYMAQRGYLLFILDNRGSDARGFAFESCTFRHFGVEEMADQMEGVKFLKSLPYVDAERLGVHGWSFGGFMTANLMLTYPEVFKVGVAGGPVVDWKYYEVMYGERYMDTPEENPQGYKASSLLSKVGNLKGRLQVIVGYNDPTCVLQHSLSFLRACEDAGTQPDYFVYPGQGHNMMGKDMVHLHERITRYFDDYLK